MSSHFRATTLGIRSNGKKSKFTIIVNFIIYKTKTAKVPKTKSGIRRIYYMDGPRGVTSLTLSNQKKKIVFIGFYRIILNCYIMGGLKLL